MAIHIITDHPEDLLKKFEQTLHYTDSHWAIDKQNGYIQRLRDADYPYYFRHSLKEGKVEILFADVHNQYSTHYVNHYAGELVGHLLSIFSGDNTLKHLEASPFTLPNT